jgi:drug/metabolite transporter (DMT)-like permease
MREWPSVLLGLLAALSWGGSDFLGGLASKRSSAVLVVAAAEVIGMALMTAAALGLREAWPSPLECLWAGVAGTVGLGGIFLLYTSLSTEKMGVVAPLAGVVAAGVASALGVTLDGFPTWLQLTGFGLALLGIWLLSNPKVTGVTPRALLIAVGSGVCSGFFFFCIRQASHTGAYWPNFLERAAGLVVLVAVSAAAKRPNWAVARLPWAQLALLGVLDTGGALLFTLAARSGRLDVATVVASLYPGGTTLLAWVGLKEPITRPQWAGIALALAAIALIAV